MASLFLLLLLFAWEQTAAESTEYELTQCDCLAKVFPPLDGSFNALTPQINDNDIQCGSGTPFPDDAGATIITEGLVTNIPQAFFGGAQEQSFVIALSVTTEVGDQDSDNTNLIEIDGQEQFRLRARNRILELTEDGNVRFQDTNFRLGGDRFIGLGLKVAETGNEMFICQGLQVNQLFCSQSQALSDAIFFPRGDIRTLFAEPTGVAKPVTLRRVRLENNFADETDFNQVVRDVIQAMEVTLVVPQVVQTNFDAIELVPVEIDLRETLSDTPEELVFIVDNAQLEPSGVLNVLPNNGVFTFTPNAESIVAFDMDYGIGSCFNEDIPLTITVAPNSPPVPLENILINAFAGATVLDKVSVVIDNDFEGGILPLGSFEFLQTPADVTFFAVSGGNCLTVPVTTLTVIDSEIEFCIETDAAFSQGVETVDFIVRDEQNGEAQGQLDIQGQAPVRPLEVQPIEVDEDLENGEISVSLLGENVLENEAGFEIKLSSLPSLDEGTVFKENDGPNEPVDIGDTLQPTETLLFFPVEGFFNALEGQPNGADGIPIGDCDENERKDGFCPVEVGYTVIFGGFESAVEGFVSFVVNAVDNFDAEITAENDLIQIEVTEGDENTFQNLPSFVITSDNGESVFALNLKIEASSGASFQVNGGEFAELLQRNIETSALFDVNGDEVPNCIQFRCLNGIFTGTTTVLADLLKIITVEIDLQEEELDPLLTFEIQESTETVNFAVTFVQPAFFDSNQNVGLVAGSAAGAMVLIVGVLFFRLRSRDNAMANNALLAAEAKVQDEIARGKTKAPPATKKTKQTEVGSTDVEEVGQGWEKHLDPESNDYFYYNVNTGETTWELPAEAIL